MAQVPGFRWICLDINTRYCRSEYCNDIKATLKSILGPGCREVVFIGNVISDGVVENALDSYVFVKCNNVLDHVHEISNSKFFRNILSSYDNISYLSQKEMDDLSKSWTKSKESKARLGYGDVGYVKSGVFSKLYGIVLGCRGKRYEMLFKFCRGYSIAMISEDNCTPHGKNIFEYMKVPQC